MTRVTLAQAPQKNDGITHAAALRLRRCTVMIPRIAVANQRIMDKNEKACAARH